MVTITGPANARLLIVGEAGGAEELRAGRPFVGPSGRVLWGALSRYKIDRSTCQVTNVVQTPPEGRAGNPTQVQILAEWGRLDAEMQASQAEVILLLGGIALRRVTGIERGITSLHGYVLLPEDCREVAHREWAQVGVYKTSRKEKYTKGDPKYGWVRTVEKPTLPPNVKWIIPCLHPSGIMRNGFANIQDFSAAIAKVARALNVGLDPIRSVAYGNSCWPVRIDEASVIALDIETPRDNHSVIERIGLSCSEETISVPWDSSIATFVSRLLSDRGRTIICHNASFDIPILEAALGIETKAKVVDTMIAAQILTPDLPKGLEKVAPRYLDVSGWKHLSGADPGGYNAKDAFVTDKIWSIEKADLEFTGQLPIYETVMEGLRALWEAQERGIRIDLSRKNSRVASLINELSNLTALWPHPGVDVGSPKQMAGLLYGKLGMPVQKNKFGGYTTDEAALRYLKLQYPDEPALDHAIKHRKIVRDITAWSKLTNDTIHPRFMPIDKDDERTNHGASTLRIQARDPNVMNMDHEGRKLIIPRPGMQLVYIDWKQAEARIEAEAADDDVLRQAIEDGIHDANAKALGVDKVRAKNFWYGTGRGAGPRKLVQVFRAEGFYDITEAQCRAAQEALFTTYPGWAAWRNRLVQVGRAQGYIENPFKLRRYFFHSAAAPQLIGWYPQSTVACMLWRVLAGWPNVTLLTPMHDAVLIETDLLPAAQGIFLRMSMEFPEVGPKWYCPGDVKLGSIGESWGDIEERYEAAKATAIATL